MYKNDSVFLNGIARIAYERIKYKWTSEWNTENQNWRRTSLQKQGAVGKGMGSIYHQEKRTLEGWNLPPTHYKICLLHSLSVSPFLKLNTVYLFL